MTECDLQCKMIWVIKITRKVVCINRLSTAGSYLICQPTGCMTVILKPQYTANVTASQQKVAQTHTEFVLPHTNSYSRPITYLESAMRFRTLYSPCKVAKIQVCLLLARVSIHSCVPCEVLLVQKLPQKTGNCIIVCYHRFFFLSQPSVENYSVTWKSHQNFLAAA